MNEITKSAAAYQTQRLLIAEAATGFVVIPCEDSTCDVMADPKATSVIAARTVHYHVGH